MWQSSLRAALRYRLDLKADMATPEKIREGVEAGVTFRGTNLWVLFFAILVASVGLNVNSTAVIIGAMLISPLMGPIVAIGFGAATFDVPLIRKGAKNLFVATLISVGTSALYFWLTPLRGAGSELLARTSPTVWDVLIALFGGLAGAVGFTRRAFTNVVPGVAIATALMPPLCTVGYGLGTGHWAYAAGAFYLFFINSVYISLAAFLVVEFLGLPGPTFNDLARERHVHRITWTIALLTALPSVWLGYRLVRKAVFENNARRFVDEQLTTIPATYVVARQLDPAARTVNVLLAGKRLPTARLDSIRARLPTYRLSDARLTIRQGMALYDSADARALRTALLEDVQHSSADALAAQEARLNQLQQLLTHPPTAPLPPIGALLREVQAEHPAVRRLGISWLVQPGDTGAWVSSDSLLVVRLALSTPLDTAEQGRLTRWLSRRTQARRVQLLLETPVVKVAPTAARTGRRATRRRR